MIMQCAPASPEHQSRLGRRSTKTFNVTGKHIRSNVQAVPGLRESDLHQVELAAGSTLCVQHAKCERAPHFEVVNIVPCCLEAQTRHSSGLKSCGTKGVCTPFHLWQRPL